MSLQTWFQEEADKELRCRRTEYLVKATSCEHLGEWSRFAKESERRPRGVEPVEWVQTNPGTLFTIAKVKGRPICVNLSWDWIAGALVCFWEATSRLVDYDLVEPWLKEKLPNVRQQSDAMNFHNIVLAIRRKS